MAQPPNSPAPGSPDANDPSMEEILASIRRILNEDDPAAKAPDESSDDDDDDVLVLDRSMMVTPPEAAARDAAPPDRPAALPPPAMEVATSSPPNPYANEDGLVAPSAAAAAASAFGGLARSLSAGKSAQVWGGGPTLEDMVRAELRPLLKEWLDANLPQMVQRMVQAEIERVAGRPVP